MNVKRMVPFFVMLAVFAVAAMTGKSSTMMNGFLWGMGREAAHSVWRR